MEQNQKTITLLFKSINNNCYELKDVNSTDTIYEVKEKLEIKTGIPAIYQRFIYKGKCLTNDNEIQDYNFFGNAPIYFTYNSKSLDNYNKIKNYLKEKHFASIIKFNSMKIYFETIILISHNKLLAFTKEEVYLFEIKSNTISLIKKDLLNFEEGGFSGYIESFTIFYSQNKIYFITDHLFENSKVFLINTENNNKNILSLIEIKKLNIEKIEKYAIKITYIHSHNIIVILTLKEILIINLNFEIIKKIIVNNKFSDPETNILKLNNENILIHFINITNFDINQYTKEKITLYSLENYSIIKEFILPKEIINCFNIWNYDKNKILISSANNLYIFNINNLQIETKFDFGGMSFTQIKYIKKDKYICYDNNNGIFLIDLKIGKILKGKMGEIVKDVIINDDNRIIIYISEYIPGFRIIKVL